MQFQGKCMIQSQENSKNAYFGPDLGPLDTNSGCQFFLALSVTIYHGQLSSCTISEKTSDPILRKFTDRPTIQQTDGWTDRQTDESTFTRY